MNDYTMTFTYDGDFDLPDKKERIEREVPKMVLEKLRNHEFELVDFNLTENYDNSNAGRYIRNPSVNRSVLEIRIGLKRTHLASREAIYDRCLNAMEKGELGLAYTEEKEDKDKGFLQSIIIFDSKENLKKIVE